MSKLEALRSQYETGGLTKVLRMLWMHLVLRQPLSRLVDDVLLHKVAMAPRLGYWPRISYPQSFNEKVMHRKLLTDESRYTRVADKSAVREYVRQRVGDQILSEVFEVTDDPTAIRFDDLPNRFVLKPTHASGLVYLVDDKRSEDFGAIRSMCEDWLDASHGAVNEEYWYADIDPQILLEERLGDEDGGAPLDYKFFVFHGRVECVQVDYDRFTGHTRRLYAPDWTPLDVSYEYPMGAELDEPPAFDRMVDIAETLGAEFDFVRVDLYNPRGDDVVFGELTLAPEAGGGRFRPTDYDFELGRHW